MLRLPLSPVAKRIGFVLFLWVLPAIAFMTVFFSNVRNTGSDPRATLLVSESILTHGTIQLDHYGNDVLDRYGRAVRKKKGHRYNYFPLGTAMVSLPAVALAKACGYSMVESEPAVQMIIASVTAALMLLLLIKIALLFLSPCRAGLLAVVYWFGTSLASTCGTALWSHNFAVLFALAAIYCVLQEQREPGRLRWISIGICLFLSYLCRPNMALLAPALLLFYFSFRRGSAVKAGAVIGMLLLGFIAFSLHEYSQILPDYYLPQRLGNYEINQFPDGLNIPQSGYFLTAVFGNLFSPARGLFVFSPFILFSWCLSSSSAKTFKVNRSWLWVGVAWPVAHLITISLYPLWWAGHSFGSRLMVDVLPGLFLLSLCCRPPRGIWRIVGTVLFAISAVFAVVVNSIQGLNNPYTAAWNGSPNIDRYPQYLFDWKYPQFLHNQTRHELRQVEHGLPLMTPVVSGERYLHNSMNLLFVGWSGIEPELRWSEGTVSRIYFRVDLSKAGAFKGRLSIDAGTLGQQRVEVELNGRKVFCGKLEGWDVSINETFPTPLLKNGTNCLRFILPDARSPGNGDPRVLALALRSVCLQ